MAKKKVEQQEKAKVVSIHKYTMCDFDVEWFSDFLKEHNIKHEVSESKLHRCMDVSVELTKDDDPDLIYKFFRRMKHDD